MDGRHRTQYYLLDDLLVRTGHAQIIQFLLVRRNEHDLCRFELPVAARINGAWVVQ